MISVPSLLPVSIFSLCSTPTLEHVHKPMARDTHALEAPSSLSLSHDVTPARHPRNRNRLVCTEQTMCRQSLVCRVPFVGHSANILLSATITFGKKSGTVAVTEWFACTETISANLRCSASRSASILATLSRSASILASISSHHLLSSCNWAYNI